VCLKDRPITIKKGDQASKIGSECALAAAFHLLKRLRLTKSTDGFIRLNCQVSFVAIMLILVLICSRLVTASVTTGTGRVPILPGTELKCDQITCHLCVECRRCELKSSLDHFVAGGG
jgi:hypothetical protein